MIPVTEYIEQINKTIEDEGEVVFVSYALCEEFEQLQGGVLSGILEKYNHSEWVTPIFSYVKELTSNANKANVKKIISEEAVLFHKDDPLEIVKELKKVLNESALKKYAIKCRMRGLSTRVYIKNVGNILTIRVINPLPLDTILTERVQSKIESASGYDSIAEFFIENPDPLAEGMGLGLSMVVVLLKGIGIDYKNFSISSDMTSKTCATLVIPL